MNDNLEAEAKAIEETNPQPQPQNIIHVPPPQNTEGLQRDKESDDHATMPFEGEDTIDLPLTKHWRIRHANALNAEQNKGSRGKAPTTAPTSEFAPTPESDFYRSGFSVEAWVPGMPLQLFYGTWNMAQKNCNPEEIRNHFVTPNAHIIAICTQENGPYVGTNTSHNKWEKVLVSILEGYTLVESTGLWAVHLAIFARTADVAPHVTEVHADHVKTGSMGNSLGNKGGVGVGLSITLSGGNKPLPVQQPEIPLEQAPHPTLEGVTIVGTSNKSVISFLFIGAHLTAHQENHEKRNEDYLHIVKHLKLGTTGPYDQRFVKRRLRNSDNASPLVAPPQTLAGLASPNMTLTVRNFGRTGRRTYTPLPTRDVTEEFDVCCFFGDLNYRIEGTAGAIRHIIRNHRALRAALTANDQLVKEMAKGLVFHGFEELPLTFCPTYKLKKVKKDKKGAKVEQQKLEKSKSDKIAPSSSKSSVEAVDENEVPTTFDDEQYEDGPKARMPAYCDRILLKSNFRTMSSTAVAMNLYTDVRRITTSDHRPVALMATVQTECFAGSPFEEDTDAPKLRRGCN